MKKNDIRVFLESPRTLEPVSEKDKKECKSIQKMKKAKRKMEKLACYVPRVSVYEQQDMSKLTERQRLLAIKFQTMNKPVNSLFLAVNNIKVTQPTPIKKRGQACRKCIPDFMIAKKFVDWLVEQHTCKYKNEIKGMSSRLKNLTDGHYCICANENEIYQEIHGYLGLKCCNFSRK